MTTLADLVLTKISDLPAASAALGTTQLASNNAGVSERVTIAQIVALFQGETSWTAPTLVNSWVNNGAPFEVAGYRKDGFGIVHLHGLVANGIANTVFTLPAGYRPGADTFFAVLDTTANGVCSLSIDHAGVVSMVGGAHSTLSLSGISFYGT
jgi:hypothetical protein